MRNLKAILVTTFFAIGLVASATVLTVVRPSDRTDYAFVEGRGQSVSGITDGAITETATYLLLFLPVILALLGWLTATVICHFFTRPNQRKN